MPALTWTISSTTVEAVDRPETGQSSFPVIGPQGRRAGKDLTASTLPDRELREAWSTWLESVFAKATGTSLVTLTFAPRRWESDAIGPLGPTRSRVARAGERFASALTAALASPSFFIVREIGGWNGRAHLHGLISLEDVAPIYGAMRLHEKRDGFVTERRGRIAPAEYVSKYVSKSDRDWWMAGGPMFQTGRETKVEPDRHRIDCECCRLYDADRPGDRRLWD